MLTLLRDNRQLESGLMILLFLFLTLVYPVGISCGWQKLQDGLQFGEFTPKEKSIIWDHKIVILKIDPLLYAFRLLSASEHSRKSRTVNQWCKEFGLVAAINASMYQRTDPLKSTGYMKNYEHFNNALINKHFGSLMVFNPIDSTLPQVQIIDRRLQKEWESLMTKYNTVVQNYRMISNGKKVGWPQKAKRTSMAAIGMDRDDNVLFILSRTPYSTHDFIHALLSLPIRIQSAMYTEGGPQATLYFKTDTMEKKLMGTYEPDLTGYTSREPARAVPNVIGIVKRK